MLRCPAWDSVDEWTHAYHNRYCRRGAMTSAGRIGVSLFHSWGCCCNQFVTDLLGHLEFVEGGLAEGARALQSEVVVGVFRERCAGGVFEEECAAWFEEGVGIEEFEK